MRHEAPYTRRFAPCVEYMTRESRVGTKHLSSVCEAPAPVLAVVELQKLFWGGLSFREKKPAAGEKNFCGHPLGPLKLFQLETGKKSEYFYFYTIVFDF